MVGVGGGPACRSARTAGWWLGWQAAGNTVDGWQVSLRHKDRFFRRVEGRT
jgi:hypothetical protein